MRKSPQPIENSTVRREPDFFISRTLLLATLCWPPLVSACSADKSAAPASAPSAKPATIPHITVPAISAAEIDSLVQKVVTDKQLIGVSVGVMQDGNVVLTKGYGVRSIEPREPLTTSTMFPIGSVTKQFTCSSALLLAQDGKLSMQDPVAKYVPTATRASEITLLDAGQHVTGYRDYYPLDFVVREMQKDESGDTIIGRYATRPLDFNPGSRWSYSNTNFLILGKAIEKASGQSVGDFMSQRIFVPLGMTRTKFDPPATDSGMSHGYTTYALAKPTLALREGKGWTGAAGAIFSTPTDLLKWDLALIDGTLLSPTSFATLTTPRILTDGRSTGYGCGLNVQLTGNAVVFSHGGAVAGSVAQNIIIPATRSAIVVVANADFASTGEITSALVAKLTPHIDVPKIAGLTALDAAKAFLTSIEQDKIDRTTLGDDFNALLTDKHVADDRASLAAIGKISDVRVTRTVERGGMEVAIVQFKVGATQAQSSMYRSPDGKIQQFLINRL
ncbi:MAG: serine hydrolase domain-containing protein [Gemmatimonadaceae bacterium]